MLRLGLGSNPRLLICIIECTITQITLNTKEKHANSSTTSVSSALISPVRDVNSKDNNNFADADNVKCEGLIREWSLRGIAYRVNVKFGGITLFQQ